MDWLKSLYPEVYQILQEAIPTYWPELKLIFGPLFEEPLPSIAILPLACSQAVNGQPREALPVSAALIATRVTTHIFDKLRNQARLNRSAKQASDTRAWNYASAIHILSFNILSKSSFPPEIFHQINQLFIDAFLCLVAGQDRDIAGLNRTIEDHWTTIELKTATIYAAACASGALVGTEDPKLIKACYNFGYHLGLGSQVLYDLESIWQPKGISDLKQGKVTLPLIYGLQFNHPDRDELVTLVETNQFAAQADRVKEILDKFDTKAFLIWTALKEREQALDAIKVCPNEDGKAALESFVTGMFGDIDTLLKLEEDKQV